MGIGGEGGDVPIDYDGVGIGILVEFGSQAGRVCCWAESVVSWLDCLVV